MSFSSLTSSISNTHTNAAALINQHSNKASKTSNEADRSPIDTNNKPPAAVNKTAATENSAAKQVQQAENAKTMFLTQKIAQAPLAQDESADTQARDGVEEFRDYMSKTPEERWYEALLAQKGLTEESLAALPPEERMKIVEEIKEEIEKRIADRAGIDTDAAELVEPPS